MTKPNPATEPEPLSDHDLEIIERDFEVFQVLSSGMQRKMFAELLHLRAVIREREPVWAVVEEILRLVPEEQNIEATGLDIYAARLRAAKAAGAKAKETVDHE